MEVQNEFITEIKPTINETIAAESRQLLKYCKERQFSLAKELLSTKFIDLELQDEAGCTAFHYACIYEDKYMLDLLLEKYMFPHILEEYIYHDTEHFLCLQEKNENKTILHYISEKNLIEFYEKVELYFPQKIYSTINHVTHSGYTALHLACEKGNSSILEKIIKVPGLDVNKIDCHGNTALHLACQYNKLEVVKILLLHPDINANVKNNTGDTPLHQLCKNSHYGTILIVKELLKMASIDINAKNYQHLSPAIIAREYNHYEIEAILTVAKKSGEYENNL